MHLPRIAHEQLRTKSCLQLADLATDMGDRYVKMSSGTGECAAFNNSNELKHSFKRTHICHSAKMFVSKDTL
ncbi:hypothetical protein WM40_26615 [Robbsia andropogonis]|uniref:Uncharacterized protein n=1 Tax=Robbsia andropogonis TaxID=28092 RepID=A0A0F5JSP6_9BURK|nr:hypothetical protein WM40_26615 [Robbsia andropogonis]